MADLALVAVMAIWGSSFALLRFFFSGGGADVRAAATPFALLAARMGLGTALLLAFLLVRPASRAQLKSLFASSALLAQGTLLRDGLLAGVLLAGGFLFQTEGLARTTASRSGFLTGLLVVFVPLLEFVFFRKHPALLSLIGLGAAFAGMTLLSGILDPLLALGTTQATASSAPSTLLGDLLTVGCAIVFAGHILVLGRSAKRHPVLPLLLIQLACVATLGLVIGPLFGPGRLPADLRLWLAIVYLALFATLFAFGVQTWAQQRVSPVRLALLSALEPVFAALWAALLLGERLSLGERIGGGLIIVGVVVGELSSAFVSRKMAGDRSSG